jgi:hypothetical protein
MTDLLAIGAEITGSMRLAGLAETLPNYGLP